MKEFYSNGKLLISGEYVVLDGATALAIPTQYGQSLRVEPLEEEMLYWNSYDYRGEIWLEEAFSLGKDGMAILKEQRDPGKRALQERLEQILREANKLNPGNFRSAKGFMINTRLDFPNHWGLGTSSTLINNVADWFGIDPYELLNNTFGGSGYDIASARHDYPITFTRKEEEISTFSASFNPPFRDSIFFVHLNRKQSSRESIRHYRNQPKHKLLESIEKVSGITHQLIHCESITAFELLLEIHENIIATLINRPKVKSELFPDYPGMIKSLGGWGGDFIMATGGATEMDYFRRKGYRTIIPYKEMVLWPT